ncbi:hypothetical protein Scep_016696 [Stephania cephalantha]|uniref:Uncharacterized protein n=1 Tax=Stephania cephalantha TaxID=152367 RepID=A0AAP0IN54_9MAGN
MSVEVNEHDMEENFAIDGLTLCAYDYRSEEEDLEVELEVSPPEAKTFMRQVHKEGAEKEIEAILKRPEEPQKENKED